MQEYRVIIAGSRNLHDYELVRRECDRRLRGMIKSYTVIIVSGHAAGADFLGERYAQERDLRCEVYPADWSSMGKAAGPIRNARMASASDALIAFWDGKSSGTSNMIKTAKAKGLEVVVVRY